MNSALQQLLARPDIWRQRDRHFATSRFATAPVATNQARGHATGFAALDRILQGGGWPRSALTELLLAQPGIGELHLLTPLLAALSRRQLLQVWINPPLIPYAPALQQHGIALESLLIVRGDPRHHLWACEQALRSTGCGSVLYWPARPLRYAELRKLQVAAAAQNAVGFLWRDNKAAQQTSPAALRLQLATSDAQLSIRVIKQRGGEAGQTLLLPRAQALEPLPPFPSTQSARRALPMVALDSPKMRSRPTAPVSLSAPALR